MHSWKDMLDLLEAVGMPESLGFQCDLAHTYLYLMGYNAPEYATASRWIQRRRVFRRLSDNGRCPPSMDN